MIPESFHNRAPKAATLRQSRKSRGRSGFTLLEVLLALALAVVVITALAGAIRLHLGIVEKQQRKIELREIGRSVLTMMHNDLRSALQYKPDDYSGLENLAVSQEMISGITAATGTEAADPDADPEATGEADAAAEEEDPEACVSCRPTMNGDATSLSVDVSRMPRIDEYAPIGGAKETDVQLPNDVKTIGYFISAQPPPRGASQFIPLSQTQNGGLYRRQIDRAVASYNGELGINKNVDNYADLIAPEVVAAQFRYFDGEQWLAQWDSEEEGGFPSAIEILIVVDMSPDRGQDNAAATALAGSQNSASNSEYLERFYTVVHLPAAEPGADEEQ